MAYIRIFFAAVLIWLASFPAHALQVTLTPNDPIATFDFPSGWSVNDIKRGIEVKSPDSEVFVWFEVYAPQEYTTLVVEHESYFKKQGVVITGGARTATDTVGAATVKATHFPATWNGKPTVLRYLAYDLALPSGKQILMTYWASPEGDRKHDAAMKRIIESMQGAK